MGSYRPRRGCKCLWRCRGRLACIAWHTSLLVVCDLRAAIGRRASGLYLAISVEAGAAVAAVASWRPCGRRGVHGA
eukprot:10272084-Alexandrium_andersonii.AAC.1